MTKENIHVRCVELVTIGATYLGTFFPRKNKAMWPDGAHEIVTRQNAEAVIAAKDARIAELERRLKEVELEHTGVRNSYFAEKRKARTLEADNKRLREALSEIADGNFLFPSEFRFSARAALGEVKP